MNPLPEAHCTHHSAETALKVSGTDPLAAEKISSALIRLITGMNSNSELMRCVLCIGSDRSTGDALGPLVGSCLIKNRLPRTLILGTLAQPVHALNLGNHLRQIAEKDNPFLVIAVDASLGKPGNVGLIEVAAGPLFPGAGVNKRLPPVGNIHLSGIVNLGGFMEQMVLQSTRLFHVMEMSTVIAEGLRRTLIKI
jgi:putative sporulation protein YyaC